jgi:hypothetical protein
MSDEKYVRQSFLGNQEAIRTCAVGIVGLGGGGSHVVQQLAHIGFFHFKVFDADAVEESNLNRLVGASLADATNSTPKVVVANRLIKSLNPGADVEVFQCRWQEVAESLRQCDIVFGCVDSFAERQQLEICTRRYLMPYIDIGMDVHCVGDEPPRVGGQVILSMPGGPCMFCVGFLTDEKLAKEASNYGDAGPRPQVVWANGILASAGVGIVVDLLTDWTRALRDIVYLSYDGNSHTLKPHVRLQYLEGRTCPHYMNQEVGDPLPIGSN